MTKRKRTYLKNVEFEMRTWITLEIGPNKVITFSEKCPGREKRKTAKLSNATFLVSGSKVSIEEQNRQQPNAEV
jgi:hypothetical protein